MDKTMEQLEAEHGRQHRALSYLGDEVMSMLHAHSLREPSMDSERVVGWLRLIYDEIQEGLGNPRHFVTNRQSDS